MCRCSGSRSPAARATASAPPPRRPPAEAVALRYRGTVALLVKGAVSGRAYALRPGDARVDCDPRDAPAFLKSPLFELRGT
jgi:hypothetical protein